MSPAKKVAETPAPAPAKKAAKKAAHAAKRAAKRAQAHLLGRDRETLDLDDASDGVRAALKVERKAARVQPRDAEQPVDAEDGATVVRVWQSAATLRDTSIADEVSTWASDPTG